MKKLEYAESIDFASQALNIVNNFQNETKLFASNNVLEVKLLLRRAKSLEMQNQWEQAKLDLDKVLMLEPKNSEAQSALKQVSSKLDQLMFN